VNGTDKKGRDESEERRAASERDLEQREHGRRVYIGLGRRKSEGYGSVSVGE
jgi:hypothetical protein